MASVFGHALLASALGFHWKAENKTKLLVFGVLSSMLPDADIIAFDLGFSYTHMLGHRGISHSIFFALVWSLLIRHVFFKSHKQGNSVFTYLFLCTLSHGILDAMTTGGRGIAFFAPFSAERFFLPWRFIQVSPLHAGDFFGEWGIRVLKSEFIWIALPALLLVAIPFIWRQIKKVAIR